MTIEEIKPSHPLGGADADNRQQAEQLLAPVSLDQLAPGIAHEIHSTVQYVADSLVFLKTAFEDLLAIHARYRKALPALIDLPGQQDALAEIARAESEADVSFLLDQVPKALASTSEGIAEITALAQSIKEFARPKQPDKRPADINRALLQVLTLARNEYKYDARLTTELKNLPPVLCHIGELNRVFLALVTHAARALARDRGARHDLGELVVRTAYEDGAVSIRIENKGAGNREDGGPGHPPGAAACRCDIPGVAAANQETDIARSIIVRDHSGELACYSEMGHGVAFLIRLPVDGVSLVRTGD